MSSVVVILCYIISLPLIIVNVNKFMHIFQQSFYEMDEFFPAIKTTKSARIQIYEVVLIVLAALSHFIVYFLLLYAALSVLCAYLTINHRPIAKKKFVYTTRVKITFAIIFLIILASIIGVYYISSYELSLIVFLVLALYKYVSIAIMLLGNLLAQPILKLINLRYIKEAKKIILSNSNMKIIGITGSYGKTSTKNIVASLLEEKYITVMTPKSFNTTLGVVKTIREEVKPYTEVFVCEMGAARLGEIKEICNIVSPDISVITSIGPQHLTSFKSMDNIIKGKFEIITNAKKDSVAVLNIDNEYIQKGISLYAKEKNIIDFSLDNILAKKKFLKSPPTKITVETKLLGKHNIYNIVCAIAIARELDMTIEEIKRGIKKIKPVEHRLELKTMGGILALDDAFNSNPEGSKAAIETLCMFKDKYKVLVTPGMIELGEKTDELNEKFGEYASVLDYVILVGEVTTKYIKKGLENKEFKNYIIVKDIYEAFSKLQEIQISHENLIALFENDLPDSYIK